jgi:hypothetical protein
MPNGTLHIEFRPYEVTQAGEIRAVAEEAA